MEAVRLFRAYPEDGPGTLVGRLHDGLRGTRGAAVAVAEIVPGQAALRWAGVGNIAASIVAREGARSLVSHNGIVGHQMRRIQEMTYPWTSGSLVLVGTDGIRPNWRLEDHPGIVAHDPSLIAGLVFRDCLRGRDDATVLVVGGAPPARA